MRGWKIWCSMCRITSRIERRSKHARHTTRGSSAVFRFWLLHTRSGMAENLVIVESPAKARTIKKYLGKDFEVLASYGHVRDLVPKEGAVDPDDGFAMKYQLVERNERHVEAIAKALKKSKSLYLATDPDREGEAIAWHLYEILKQRGDLKQQDRAPRGVPRDHPQRHPRGGRRTARTVARPGQRAAGAPRAGLPGRLQSLAAAVEEGAARPVGRARAESRRCA